MAGPDNANPAVLSVAQLPSRARTKSGSSRGGSAGPESKYDHLLSSSPNAAFWGFEGVSVWPSDEDDTDGDTDASLMPDPIDEQELYDLISPISDPEHPHTLGQLSVVNLPDIHISNRSCALPHILVEITPTITHCSLATIIGLAVRVRLEQALPPNYRVDVRMKAGTHSQDDQVNKQLADKERVAAALENETLGAMLNKMLENCT